MKFKVGDRVKRIKNCFGDMHPGDEGIVLKVNPSGSVIIEGYCSDEDYSHDPDMLELVKLQFEKGKWYCENEGILNGRGAFKLDSNNKDGKYVYSERIYSNGDYYKKYGKAFWKNITQIREASLEEIQEYLPEHHPDKFDYNNTRYFKYVDLDGTFIKGKIYKLREGKQIDSYCPFINERSEIDGYCNMEDTKKCFIPSTEEEYNKQNGIKIKKNMKKFKNRLNVHGSTSLINAFAEEVEKLGYKVEFEYPNSNVITSYLDNVFIARNCNREVSEKFGEIGTIILNLPKDWDKALQLAAEVEEEVPEYVEWIANIGCGKSGFMCNESSFKKGKIFCTLTDKLPPSGLGKGSKYWKEALTEEWYSQNFKPSTKEAYEAQKEVKPEVGKWYFNGNGKTLFLENEKHEQRSGFNAIGDWIDKGIGTAYDKQLRLATNKEVEDALLSYAKKKYPIGIKYESVSSVRTKHRLVSDSITYSFIENSKIYGGSGQGCLYLDGKWAEILEDKLEVNDYSVKKINHIQVKVGCQIFDKWMLESVIDFLNEYGGYYEDKSGSYWNVDQIKKVLSVFDE